jgi:hypothetical protein
LAASCHTHNERIKIRQDSSYCATRTEAWKDTDVTTQKEQPHIRLRSAVDGETLRGGKTSGILSRFASADLSEDEEMAAREEHHTVKDVLTMKPERLSSHPGKGF